MKLERIITCNNIVHCFVTEAAEKYKTPILIIIIIMIDDAFIVDTKIKMLLVMIT